MKTHSSLAVTLATSLRCLAALALVSSASAAVLANYNFNTNLTSSDLEADSVAGAIASGGGLGTLSTHYGRSTSGNDFYARASQTVVAVPPATNDYFFFTLTINPGTTYDLQSLTYTHQMQIATGGSTAGQFTSNYDVRWSIDNYAASIGGSSLTKVGLGSTAAPQSIDLTSYTGVSGTIEIRFYVTDSTDLNEDINRIDNIVLNSVPEPTSGLLILGSVALGLCRRSRRR